MVYAAKPIRERNYGTLQQMRARLVSSCVDAGPGVEDEELVGLSVGVHDGLEVLLVLFAALAVDAHHGLAAAGHRGLGLRVDPGQNLRAAPQTLR